MGTIRRFEEIEAWQTARRLTKAIYELTAGGDFSRDFGLKDQRSPVASLRRKKEEMFWALKQVREGLGF